MSTHQFKQEAASNRPRGLSLIAGDAPLDPRVLSAILSGGAVLGLLNLLLGVLIVVGEVMGTDSWLLYVVGSAVVLVGVLAAVFGFRLLQPVLAHRSNDDV